MLARVLAGDPRHSPVTRLGQQSRRSTEWVTGHRRSPEDTHYPARVDLFWACKALLLDSHAAVLGDPVHNHADLGQCDGHAVNLASVRRVIRKRDGSGRGAFRHHPQ